VGSLSPRQANMRVWPSGSGMPPASSFRILTAAGTRVGASDGQAVSEFRPRDRDHLIHPPLKQPRPQMPLSNASSAPLPSPSHSPGARVVRYSFSVRPLRSLLHAGLSRRYPDRGPPHRSES
jgi:hypothetical protein